MEPACLLCHGKHICTHIPKPSTLPPLLLCSTNPRCHQHMLSIYSHKTNRSPAFYIHALTIMHGVHSLNMLNFIKSPLFPTITILLTFKPTPALIPCVRYEPLSVDQSQWWDPNAVDLYTSNSQPTNLDYQIHGFLNSSTSSLDYFDQLRRNLAFNPDFGTLGGGIENGLMLYS